MPRSGEPARQRLQQAGLELFAKHGYERTTAAEIAALAGVTERTFFRHFADKREVLFGGQEKLRAALTEAIAAVPAPCEPLDVLHRAFRSLEPMLEANRPFSVPRQRVIASNPALQERELMKVAALTEALALAIRQRGVDERSAALAARIGMVTFTHAIECWFAEPSRRLGAHLATAFDTLHGIAKQNPRKRLADV